MLQNRLTIKNHQLETQLFTRRCITAFGIILALTTILLLRLVYLQVIEHRLYSTLSKQNILTILPSAPHRGLIYDRNGILLAQNIAVYSLDVIPGRIKHLNKTIRSLKKIIDITPQDLHSFYRSLKEHRHYQPVPLKYKLTEKEIARFYVNQYRFPGVIIRTKMLRYYPLGKATSNVVGYVGPIDSQELSKLNNENYSASVYIGKVGIEKYYENQLHGKVGAEEAEINANGKIVRIEKRNAPISGNNIYLTIDSKLQAYAEKALGDNSGAIVAIQPDTGEVLALVTKPDYDPNAFVTGMSSTDYHKLLDSPQHPLYNRAIRGLFSPGSTIKPFMALAGLNNGIINPDYKIYDRGWFRLPNTKHTYHDWKHDGHGWVNLAKAITVSCDVYFYNLALNMGIARIDQILSQFGFGQLTGIDMPNEVPGIVPSPKWKREHHGRPWYTGDTIITGIGQGSLLVTPIQLAAATATLAEHGRRFQPHLLLKMVMPDGSVLQQSPIELPPVIMNDFTIWNTVIHAMQQVVSSYMGTADQYGRDPGYTVAAKTGTAQVFGTYRDEERDRVNIPKKLRNNHLFLSFAPVKNPKIALVVVVEHSTFADRIARKITDFYFHELSKQKKQPPEQLLTLPKPKA